MGKISHANSIKGLIILQPHTVTYIQLRAEIS